MVAFLRSGLLSHQERLESIHLHCSEEEETFWTPTDVLLPPWHPSSANPHPPLPTLRDRYQPVDYRQPSVQLMYLATSYSSPPGVPVPAPDPVEVTALPSESIHWSSSSSSPALPMILSPTDPNCEGSRNLQLGIDPDTDGEDYVASEQIGLD